jgi:6-pyruvoyl-tetrahydropterin synthase
MMEWVNENWLYVVIAGGAIVGFETVRLIFKKVMKKFNKRYLVPVWHKMKKLKNINTLIILMVIIILGLITWNIYYMFFR